MNFQQLSYLIEISKCGSINKAAQKLMMSQSGISTAIRDLEEELGIQFFVRGSRGVHFTPEGKEFLGYAVSLLEHKTRIENIYADSKAISGQNYFSVSSQRYPFTEDAFMRLLKNAPEAYHFSIKETDMDSVIDDVYDHRADLGVIFLTDATQRIITHLLESRELEFHELASVSPCIYVRKDHPLTKKDNFTVDDLATYPYLSFEQVQGVSADFSEEYPELAMRKPARSIVVNSRSAALHALQCTDAFTTGSGLLVENISVPGIITIPLPQKDAVRLGWIHNKSAKLTPTTEKFISLLDESLKDAIEYTKKLQKK